MQFVSDLHLHSKYSRAVSQQMILPEMARWASKKGIDILSASDWTHPLWFREIKAQLEEKAEGLFNLKSQMSNLKSTSEISNLQKEPLFLLSTEIASIYKQGERLRRIHNLVFSPNFETAEKINKELVKRGCNLHSDGRPIIGLSSKNLLELILSIDEKCLLIPCHVWTPHFGIYGSASGFDCLSEAFGDMDKYIYGVETGLSSDPEMNWQMRELNNRSILSFSDAHSLPKMGREATVFELEKPSYENVRRAIMRLSSNTVVVSETKQSQEIATSPSAPRNDNRILYTIEFYPEEGKYHFSGHRNCGVVRGPEAIRKDGNVCSVCKRELTEGVLYRVGQLGNKDSSVIVEEKISSNGIKWYVDKAKKHPPYVKLVPLLEIVAEGLESTVSSEKAKEMFDTLCKTFGSEIEVLLKAPLDKIEKISGVRVKEGIEKVRKGDIVIDPGFDGEYGKVKIWNEEIQSSKFKVQNGVDVSKEQLGLGF